jgi:CRP-like cAMP-binding protein
MIDPTLRIAKATQPYLFQNSFILTNLPTEDLHVLEDNTKIEEGKRGDVLFRQGTFPNGVYWLLSGKIKIFQETSTGQKQTLYIYSDGDLIAYRQFMADEPHPVTTVLIEDSTFRFIPAEMFRGLLASSPFFSRNILTALAREFTVWMNRMTVFSQYPVRYRLILALLVLQEQYRMSGSEPGVVTITRTDLAEFVGAKLETVVRVLNTLKSANLVAINGRRILLPDLDGLLDILQGEKV